MEFQPTVYHFERIPGIDHVQATSSIPAKAKSTYASAREIDEGIGGGTIAKAKSDGGNGGGNSGVVFNDDGEVSQQRARSSKVLLHTPNAPVRTEIVASETSTHHSTKQCGIGAQSNAIAILQLENRDMEGEEIGIIEESTSRPQMPNAVVPWAQKLNAWLFTYKQNGVKQPHKAVLEMFKRPFDLPAGLEGNQSISSQPAPLPVHPSTAYVTESVVAEGSNEISRGAVEEDTRVTKFSQAELRKISMGIQYMGQETRSRSD